MTWAPDYVTTAELKNYVNQQLDIDDALVALWITTASRNVDDHCGRQFGQVAGSEARTYLSTWDRHLGCYVAEVDDLQDLTGLIVNNANGNAVTGPEFGPANALLKGKPYERILTSTGGKLSVTARWGWTAVPSAVKVGLMLQGARLAARRDSPFGIAGSPSDGSEVRLLAQLDPDFRTALKPLRRTWWAA